MNDTKSCDTCWYEYFDERAYPCSMCIRGAVRTDMFMPKGRQTKAEQTKPIDDEEQFCREHKCTYYRPQEGGCTKNVGGCPFDTEPTTEDCSKVCDECLKIYKDGLPPDCPWK